MITFILPGFSAKNKEWAEEVAKNLSVDGEVRPVFWDHWTDTKKTLKPAKKADDLIDILLKDNCNIIAKSVGTFVAVLMVAKIPERIGKVILCGIPSVSDKRLKVFREAFENFPMENVIVFQNQNDPLGSYDKVSGFMQKVNPKIKVISKPRSDHHYPYYEDFQKFIG